MRTALTELLQIEYPIIQGAMAWVSEHKLVSAVANAGATGVIALGGRDAEWTRNEIRACKELTDKPFGVNLMLMAPNKDELVDVIIQEKPAFVTLGAGNPVPYIKPLQEAGIKVIPVVPSLKLAKRIEEAGADAMIVEGTEAGGHIGSQTTMSLMENILPEISIPVVVAGSIVDGRGLAAALLMGAQGVQMGSRFLLAEECQAHQNMKEAIIKATDTDSVVTGLLSGHGGVRSLKNEFTTRYLAAETDGVTTPEERTKMSQGTNKRAAIDGDVVNGAVQVGQALNRLVAIEPAHTIVQTVMNEAIMSIRKAQRLLEIV
ncbi:nitronate monooxygenase [uncultured Veillonella sp.]|uniref:nitronate monooxygenase n=1 Tax=uncultured Veillonella sp. TaxID=159268 RepID=UPI0025F6C4E5|nr:nitronate monooxygenase [uncultured Veillonella sp.]